MKNIFSILFLLVATSLFGSPVTSESISLHATEEAAVSNSNNNEESPFLIEREDAKYALARNAQRTTSIATLYPPRHSISRQIGHFFKNLIGTTKAASSKTPTLQLSVQPTSFSIAEDPELTVTLKITNTKKELLMLSFPSNQRLEMILKDTSGTILTRWSQDRSFDPSNDIVVINPSESILYTEKIETSMMKEGITYLLEVSLAHQPGYTLSQKITPQQNETDHSFLKESEQPLSIETKNSPFKS